MSLFVEQMKVALVKQLAKTSKNERWLVLAVNVIFVILLAMSLAQLSWRIFSTGSSMEAIPASPAQNIASPADTTSRLSAISELHLFGKAEEARVDAPIVAPETRLQLKLKGVFASSNPEQAYAIISDSKNQDKSYRLGSQIVGGAILHAIYPDRVILKRNGRLETLRMSTSYNNKSGITAPVSNSRKTTQPSLRIVKAPPKLKKLKQTLLKDPQKIWQQVRISPVLKNGSIKGYSVEHKDKQLMRSLNLQQGDVITAVDGKPLSDPATLYGLMNQLKTKQSLSVTIERNNQEQVIQLQM